MMNNKLEKWKKDPALFMKEVFGEDLQPWQMEALSKIVTSKENRNLMRTMLTPPSRKWFCLKKG